MILNNEKKLGPTPKSTGVEQEFQQIAKNRGILVFYRN